MVPFLSFASSGTSGSAKGEPRFDEKAEALVFYHARVDTCSSLCSCEQLDLSTLPGSPDERPKSRNKQHDKQE